MFYHKLQTLHLLYAGKIYISSFTILLSTTKFIFSIVNDFTAAKTNNSLFAKSNNLFNNWHNKCFRSLDLIIIVFVVIKSMSAVFITMLNISIAIFEKAFSILLAFTCNVISSTILVILLFYPNNL